MLDIKCCGAVELVVLLVAFILVPDNVADCAATDSKELSIQTEPAFPLLFNPGNNQGPISPKRAKIVSEMFGGNGKVTVQEYMDLDSGQYAHETVSTTMNDSDPVATRQVIFSDWSLNQTFIYKPYSCITLSTIRQTNKTLDNWSVIYEDNKSGQRLRIYGVAALWLHAGYMPKKYKLLDTIHSGKGDVLKVRHQWSYKSEYNNLEFRLSFVEIIVMAGDKATNGKLAVEGTRMSLETAQIASFKTGAVLRTFNVVSVEYELSMQVYLSLLQVPVGYGCKVDQEKLKMRAQADRLKREAKFFSERLWSSSLVELEISGTRIDPVSGSRPSDTIYVELAHALDNIHGKERKLSMIKLKSGSMQIKTILNYALNVRYTIDMQTGSCSLSHLPSEHNRPEGKAYTYVEDYTGGSLHLTFSNGLRLPFDPDQIDYLFSNSDNYIVAKESKTVVGANELVTYTYLERTIDSWPYGTTDSTKFARQVRTFVTEEPVGGSKKGRRSSRTKLESVTIWVFAGRPDQSSTAESVYQINVVGHAAGLRRWPDVAHLFDVSHECYLQNEDTRPGQDYAWVEFFFPLSSRQLDTLGRYESRLRRKLHDELTVDTNLLTSFQVPRLELMFSDEGLFARALLLDVPSLHLTYRPFNWQAISVDKDTGDSIFITPDTVHCSKLCRQYSCKSMTFCMAARSCLLGTRAVFAAGDKAAEHMAHVQAMKQNKGCTTYSANAAEVGPESLPGLSKVLSEMKHYDYESEGVPQIPDDLLERDNAGEIMAEYRMKFTEYFTEKGLPAILLLDKFGDQLLSVVPASFRIEDDPFEKFGASIIGAAQDEDDDELLRDSGRIVDHFHEGLSMSRFKLQAFRAGHKDRARLLAGLTYDQCALACLDSKCGAFSYCPNRKECILTTFSVLAEASHEQLLEDDANCFISQRDFSRNFQKYPNIEQPLWSLAGRKAVSVSDCALSCMQYDTGYRACVSFEYCPKTARTYNCYLQASRHPDHIFPNFSQDAEPDANDDKSHAKTVLCDHYERSYLAEFNQIESAQFSGEVLDNLNLTTRISGKTTFECADVCLNQLKDCSAFQFCLEYSDNKDNHMQQCLMILDKLLPTNSTSGRVKIELVIDPSERDNEALIRANKFLKYSENCQVFALRPNTIEGHLRDLALGNTMTIRQKEELESRAEQPASSSGYRMSWVQYLFTFVGIVKLASLITVAGFFAYQRSERVRGQMDRLRLRVRLLM